MDLNGIRKKIDCIDYEILKLLNQRMELSLITQKFKHTVTDKSREKEVLENISRFPHSLGQSNFFSELFKHIISESKRIQNKNFNLIGFQGEHGAYSEMAARAIDPDLIPIPCLKFVDVFTGLENGSLERGILPIENSLEGAVTEVNDQLFHLDNNIRIVGEIIQPIDHCLLTIKETHYREIKLVYSHPQALAQCRGFISRNQLEPRPYYDTAGAAKMLANQRPVSAAVIASKLCAKMYDLEVIKENIMDETQNFTRFLMFAKTDDDVDGNKCSIIFTVKDKVGALHEVLDIFSQSSINLTRIESRPRKNNPGHYSFLLDFNGSYKDPQVKEILKKINKKSVFFRYLGCYPEAKRI